MHFLAVMEVMGVKIDFTLILPELILALTGTAILIADLWTKSKRPFAYIALAGIAAALVAIWPAASDPTIHGREFFGGMLAADTYTFFLKAVVLMIAGLVTLLSIDFLEQRMPHWFSEFYEMLLFATIGMLMMVSSRNIVTIYLGLETVSICSYVMAALMRRDARSNEAGLKYFLNGALASAVLLYGVSLLYGLTGTFHLNEIAAVIARGQFFEPLFYAAVIFIIAGFGFKVAAAPFHLWAPDVYEGAPTPVTAFFSVGPKAAAFAAIVRVFLIGLAGATDQWALIIATMAAITMFIGNLTALTQTNLKRMMAYSSIAHAGYMLVGVASASALGTSAVLFYILAYALMNIGVFAVIVAIDNERGSTELSHFKGLARRSPAYAWAMVLFFVSLIGIPPAVGFFGKLFLFQAAIAANLTWLAILVAINSAISVGYYYNVVRTMFFEEPEEGIADFQPGANLGTTVMLTAVATVAVAIVANPFVIWTTGAALPW